MQEGTIDPKEVEKGRVWPVIRLLRFLERDFMLRTLRRKNTKHEDVKLFIQHLSTLIKAGVTMFQNEILPNFEKC